MTDNTSDEFDVFKKAKELRERYGRFTPAGLGMRAAEHVFNALRGDAETLDRLVELLRASDMEAFRSWFLELASGSPKLQASNDE